MIITIRTDKLVSELGLYSATGEKLQYIEWEAHRQLSETILAKLEDMLSAESKSFRDITGVIYYEGPGSFTGLRIGVSVANALIYGLGIKGVQRGGEHWISEGLELLESSTETTLLPAYGQEPHITTPRK